MHYRPLRDMDQEVAAGSWNKFHVIVAGRTNGAHKPIVDWLSVSHREVSSPDQSDYLLIFCPVASRVGTDIGEALQDIPGGKPAILVVMHHTFNPDHIVAESRRQVDRRDVHLTVDCLFYEGKLLTSNRNDNALGQMQKLLGVPVFPDSSWQRFSSICQSFIIYKCPKKLWKKIVAAIIFALVVWTYKTRDMDQEVTTLQETASWKKFHVIVAGETNGAHTAIIQKLRSSGHNEVSSPQESDYLLIFCPVASRPGADISKALQDIPGGKPAILVVMHHTFDPDLIVAERKRQVDQHDVRLTVDCLFYEDKLLTSNRNDIAWSEIQKFLGVSGFPDSV